MILHGLGISLVGPGFIRIGDDQAPGANRMDVNAGPGASLKVAAVLSQVLEFLEPLSWLLASWFQGIPEATFLFGLLPGERGISS